jgi:hypothetical protein
MRGEKELNAIDFDGNASRTTYDAVDKERAELEPLQTRWWPA